MLLPKMPCIEVKAKKKLLNSCQQSILLDQAGFRQPESACVICVQCVSRGLDNVH